MNNLDPETAASSSTVTSNHTSYMIAGKLKNCFTIHLLAAYRNKLRKASRNVANDTWENKDSKKNLRRWQKAQTSKLDMIPDGYKMK